MLAYLPTDLKIKIEVCLDCDFIKKSYNFSAEK